MKFQPIFLGLTISFVTFLVLFLLGEFWVRHFVLVTETTGVCEKLDTILRARPIPGSVCFSQTPEWKVTNSHNSFGLRSPETTLEKPQGVYRILFLGDSFTYGYGVEEKDSFPRLVEEKLNGLFEGKPRVEVINGGLPGFSPILEYLYLKNEGFRFNPDLVILEFDLTDFSNDFTYSAGAIYDENGIPTAVPPVATASAKPVAVEEVSPTSQSEPQTMQKSQLLPFLPSNIKKFFHDRSVLYRWVSTQLKVMLGQPLADPEIESVSSYYTIVKEDTSNDEVLWQAPKKNITLVNEFLTERGVPLVVSAHPQGILVDGKEWYNGRLLHGLERDRVYSDRYFLEMENFLESQGIPFINLLPYFRQSKVRGMFLPFDGHFNENGHKIAAEGIVAELLKNGYH